MRRARSRRAAGPGRGRRGQSRRAGWRRRAPAWDCRRGVPSARWAAGRAFPYLYTSGAGGCRARGSGTDLRGTPWRMRVLALADKRPPLDPATMALQTGADAVVCLGDLDRGWIESLAGLEIPRIGVHGNHDPEHL